MNSGETIQSYNHQLVVTKSEKHQMTPDNHSIDDDNIDVVNDNDRDLGKFLACSKASRKTTRFLFY
jgi:hypothetical protein